MLAFAADSGLTFVGEEGHEQKSALQCLYFVEIEGEKSSKSTFCVFGLKIVQILKNRQTPAKLATPQFFGVKIPFLTLSSPSGDRISFY